MTKRYAIGLAVLATVTGLTAVSTLWAQQGPPRGAPVQIAIASLENLAPTIPVSGTVLSRFDAQLSAEVPGRIVEIADVGTRFEAGQPIAQVENTILRLQQGEFSGLVSRERARLGFLEKEVVRLEKLAAQNIAAESQLEQTQSDLGVSRSDLVVAQSRLEQVRDQLARSTIRAPFDGIVTERTFTLGERVNVGDPVVRIMSQDALEVIARAPLITVNHLAVDAEVSIESELFTGTGIVRTMVPFGDARSHMFEVRVDVNPDEWTIGQNVQLLIPTAEAREVIAVPRDALVLRREGASIFRIGEDNTAERITVTPGLGSGQLIEIFGEVEPGDQVIVRGAERLRPGQPVTVTNGSQDTAPGS